MCVQQVVKKSTTNSREIEVMEFVVSLTASNPLTLHPRISYKNSVTEIVAKQLSGSG